MELGTTTDAFVQAPLWRGLTINASSPALRRSTERSLDVLATSPSGQRVIGELVSSKAHLDVLDHATWPAANRSRTTPYTTNGFVVSSDPRRIALQGDRLADPVRGALLIGHESVHVRMFLDGSSSSWAWNEASAYQAEGGIADELGHHELRPPIAREWQPGVPATIGTIAYRISHGEQPWSP